jgi:polysaccharide chain length determinant protein (PEP-CTERM system associated)
VYKADSVVLVESQKIPETFVAATVQVMLEARLDMLKQQVLSQDRLWTLIEQFGLYENQRRNRTREETIELMRKDMTIALERGWSATRPGAFRVSYSCYDPHAAAEIANRIAQFFIDENLRQREAEAEGTSEFLDAQLAESKRQLQEQEVRLSGYKRTFNGELPQQEAALIASMGQSRVELLGTQEALARAHQNKLAVENSIALMDANLRERRQKLDAALAAGGHGTELPAQHEPSELERAQAHLRELRLRYHDEHPDVQRAFNEVARLQRQLDVASRSVTASTTEPALRPAPEPADAVAEADATRTLELKAQLALLVQEIETLDARRDRILQEVSDAQGRLKDVPIREQQLSAITRDYETSRASYSSLLNKKLTADVAKNMEREQKAEKFVMLDRARIPEKPVKPKRALLTGLGSLGSFVMSALFALLLEWKKNALLGEWELPAGVVVLGRIPRLHTDAA